eukprot:3459797-Rhodomonas_salina.2
MTVLSVWIRKLFSLSQCKWKSAEQAIVSRSDCLTANFVFLYPSRLLRTNSEHSSSLGTYDVHRNQRPC